MRKRWIVGALCSIAAVAMLLGSGAPKVVAKDTDFGRTEGERLRPLTGLTTSSERLNADIASGAAQVYEYIEPSEETQRTVDSRLKELGYPDHILDKTPWATKEGWLDDTIPYSVWQGSMKNPELPKTEDVDLNYLDTDGSMSWDYALTELSGSTRNKYQLRSDWNWEQLPVWRLVDKISWGWAADHTFYYDAKSIRNHQFYRGCRNGSCKTIVASWNYTVDGAAGAGTATVIDILSNFTRDGVSYTVTDMWGYVLFTVSRAKRSDEHGGFASLTKYWHKEPECGNFTVTFGDAPQASISCDTGYDETTDLPGNADY